MLRRFPILEIIGLMITAALALIWLYPLLWAIDTSIKQEFQTIEPIPSWLPNPPTIEAYAKVLLGGGLI